MQSVFCGGAPQGDFRKRLYLVKNLFCSLLGNKLCSRKKIVLGKKKTPPLKRGGAVYTRPNHRAPGTRPVSAAAPPLPLGPGTGVSTVRGMRYISRSSSSVRVSFTGPQARRRRPAKTRAWVANRKACLGLWVDSSTVYPLSARAAPAAAAGTGCRSPGWQWAHPSEGSWPAGPWPGQSGPAAARRRRSR